MNLISEKVIRNILDVDGYITTDVLAEISGISTSNLKHNLGLIKEDLNAYGVRLQSIPKKGVCLIADKKQRELLAQALDEEVSRTSDYYTYRKEYILETLFWFQANYTTQLFADELDVSKNTILKDLDQIHEELSKFHVGIKKIRNQGIVIEGHEFDIRQSMIDCNNSKYWNWNKEMLLNGIEEMDQRISKKAYTYLSNTYKREDLLQVQKILWEIEEELKVQFVDISFGRLMEYLTITKQRIRITKKINKNICQSELKGFPESYLTVAEKGLLKLMGKSSKGYLYETQYFAARIFVASTCTEERNYEDAQYKNIVIQFLEKIEEIIEIRDLSINTDLVHELNQTFQRIYIREVYRILDWSDLYRDIQKEDIGLFGICMTNLFQVESELDIKFRQDDVAWIVLLIRNCIKDNKNKIPVLFVHATNCHTAVYQKGRIETYFPEIIIRKSIYFKDFDEILAGDMLVVSTVPFHTKNQHIIEITKHLSKADVELIEKALDNLGDQIHSNKITEIVEEVFDTSLILYELTARNKEEAIYKMAEVLELDGAVTPIFKEKVLERENFCPTYIGNEIAIPHHYQDGIMKNRIVIAKMKHSVTWNVSEEKVKLIFLIALKYKDPIKVKMLFHFLYEMIGNMEQIQRIKQADSAEEILEEIINQTTAEE